MRTTWARLLQAVVVLVGVGALAFLLWEPHAEGRNAHATTFQIYFNDPFLAYVYVGSIPFFVALHRAFGLGGYLRRNGAVSPVTVEALRAIQHCAWAMLGFVAGGVVFILRFGDREDRPAGLFLSLLVATAAGLLATTAAMLGRKVRKALGRSEGPRG